MREGASIFFAEQSHTPVRLRTIGLCTGLVMALGTNLQKGEAILYRTPTIMAIDTLGFGSQRESVILIVLRNKVIRPYDCVRLDHGLVMALGTHLRKGEAWGNYFIVTIATSVRLANEGR